MVLVHIPNDLKDSHHQDIEGYLRRVLVELKGIDQNVKRVTSRLNYSNTDTSIPVWAGTVEDQAIGLLRGFNPGIARFGQSNRSKVYDDAVTNRHGQMIGRDWGGELPEKSKDGYGPGQALGPRAGCRYQVFIALRIQVDTNKFRHIGTLTAGFTDRPDSHVDDVMEKWARDGSDYVKYLKDNFILGGPYFT